MPYFSWLFNPPDLNGPAMQYFVSWLYACGLPLADKPSIVDDSFSNAGGTLTQYELSWAGGESPFPLSQDICDALNNPQVALDELQHFYGFGNPNAGPPVPYNPTPAATPAPPPPPTPPADPVGAYLYVNAKGQQVYGEVPGDSAPNGARYNDTRGSFVKQLYQTPFGPEGQWILTK